MGYLFRLRQLSWFKGALNIRSIRHIICGQNDTIVPRKKRINVFSIRWIIFLLSLHWLESGNDKRLCKVFILRWGIKGLMSVAMNLKHVRVNLITPKVYKMHPSCKKTVILGQNRFLSVFIRFNRFKSVFIRFICKIKKNLFRNGLNFTISDNYNFLNIIKTGFLICHMFE